MTVATRSVYVARLRRAFLLQAHPDRFRSPTIQKQQAELVKAISDRMARPDFLSYSYGESSPSTSSDLPLRYPKLIYVLETKAGSLHKHNIDLNSTVEGVLRSMADALQTTGLASLPPPPKAPTQPTASDEDGITWVSSKGEKSAIDHQYDIRSNHGRDLRHFLSTLDASEIEQRKSSRMDVTATAMVLRRDYGFAAVDGTGLGWSSDSLAILLHSLVQLHHEHSHKFAVPSFYPLRLVWSSEDQPIDLHGGTLYLNPAATPIQWLDHLLGVTPETLALHKEYRSRLANASRRVNGALDVQFQMGHSCSSKEYYDLLLRLNHLLGDTGNNAHGESSSAVALERIYVMVESASVCRRAILTREGHIRVGASMTNESIVRSVSKLLSEAREKLMQARHDKEKSKQAMTRVVRECGVQRVRRGKIVQVEEFVEALMRLLQHEERRRFVGTSIGIVGKGHSCHLGDDGSLMIPWDWK